MTNNNFKNNKTKTMTAVTVALAIGLIMLSPMTSFVQDAHAEKQSTGKMVSMIPSKSTTKAPPPSTQQTTDFNWTDCNSNYRSGWFEVQLPDTPTDQATYSWLWPQYEDYNNGLSGCNYASFQSVTNFLSDVPQGWTVTSGAQTGYSNSGLTFTLVDPSTGQPIYVDTGDSVYASQTACYTFGTNCDDQKTFQSSAWIAS